MMEMQGEVRGGVRVLESFCSLMCAYVQVQRWKSVWNFLVTEGISIWLDSWFPKCGPQTRTISNTLEMQNFSRPHSRPTKLRGTQRSIFTSPPGDLVHTIVREPAASSERTKVNKE